MTSNQKDTILREAGQSMATMWGSGKVPPEYLGNGKQAVERARREVEQVQPTPN